MKLPEKLTVDVKSLIIDLAHQFTMDEFKINREEQALQINGDEITYTEDAQDFFNDQYDYLESCLVKIVNNQVDYSNSDFQKVT